MAQAVEKALRESEAEAVLLLLCRGDMLAKGDLEAAAEREEDGVAETEGVAVGSAAVAVGVGWAVGCSDSVESLLGVSAAEAVAAAPLAVPLAAVPVGLTEGRGGGRAEALPARRLSVGSSGVAVSVLPVPVAQSEAADCALPVGGAPLPLAASVPS